MNTPTETPRMAHIAVSLGSRDAVDRLVGEMLAAGVIIARGPRVTGDGYYEAVVTADYSDQHMEAALVTNLPNYADAILTTTEIVASLSSVKALGRSAGQSESPIAVDSR